jgi:hypothetical protein
MMLGRLRAGFFLGFLFFAACAHPRPPAAETPAASPEQAVSRPAVRDPAAERAAYARYARRKLDEFSQRSQSIRDQEGRFSPDVKIDLRNLERLLAQAEQRCSGLDSVDPALWPEQKAAMDRELRELDRSFSMIRSRLPVRPPGGY